MKHNFHHFLQNIQQKINTAAAKAQTYLESQISKVTDDYVLAIASYALKLAGSSMFTTAFNKLKNDAVVRGNLLYFFLSLFQHVLLKKILIS